MKRFIAAAAIAAAAAGPAGARPTHLCNTGASNEIYFATLGEPLQRRVTEVVANPALDAELYGRLWKPLSARATTTARDDRWVVLRFDPFQDIKEILASLRRDPTFAEVRYMGDNGSTCFSTSPPPQIGRATEWRNTILDHYFLSTSESEDAIIDAGGAGAGWVRTGESFTFARYDACSAPDRRVFRFYAPGSKSHFYTADAAECGGLRQGESGWIAEGVAFGALLPVNGACPAVFGAVYTPLYRLYNDRAAFNDSNHRYTRSTAIYEEMRAKGWIGEGVALCVRDAS